MTRISDLFDPAAHAAAVDAGLVRVRPHPSLPLLVHNYTDRAVWEQAWDEVTLACRGLITHAESGVVVARPFRKFFNHSQPGAPVLDIDAPVVVTDKLDGSLGVLYPTPDGHAVATRGSFISEQAQWATEHWREHYAGVFTPNPSWTYLFEIIYPENRVVLEYDFEGLVLLGAVEIASGASVPFDDVVVGWPGRVVERLPFETLREALACPVPDDREGFVVHDPDTDIRIKIKGDEYVRLHRWLTNTTEKHVWEVLAAGQDPDEVFSAAPDELHAWLRATVADYRARYVNIEADVISVYTATTDALNTEHPDGWGRREFAAKATKTPHASLLFLLLDGRDISERIWQGLQPVGELAPARPTNPEDR